MGNTEETSLEANTVTDAESKMILRTCKNKKINQILINPTAQQISKLMGMVDPATKEFKEGILTKAMRNSIRHQHT